MNKSTPPKNIAKSAFDRLKNHSKQTNENLNYVIQRYAAERFLYRLSLSPYAENLILKGGMLLLAWHSGQPHRVTRDIDFLGKQISADKLDLICAQVCKIYADDGIIFLVDSIRSEEITEDANYRGIRLKIGFRLHDAQDNLQIDVGFGDVITPAQ